MGEGRRVSPTTPTPTPHTGAVQPPWWGGWGVFPPTLSTHTGAVKPRWWGGGESLPPPHPHPTYRRSTTTMVGGVRSVPPHPPYKQEQYNHHGGGAGSVHPHPTPHPPHTGAVQPPWWGGAGSIHPPYLKEQYNHHAPGGEDSWPCWYHVTKRPNTHPPHPTPTHRCHYREKGRLN